MEQNRKPRDKSMKTYGHLIFDKGGKDIQWKKKTTSLTSGAGKTGQPLVKLEHFLTPYTKINSKWIK